MWLKVERRRETEIIVQIDHYWTRKTSFRGNALRRGQFCNGGDIHFDAAKLKFRNYQNSSYIIIRQNHIGPVIRGDLNFEANTGHTFLYN